MYLKVVCVLRMCLKERCRPGSYYDKVKGECVLCAKNTYQPQSGQDVCFRCPGNTETDGEGATNSSFCKGTLAA